MSTPLLEIRSLSRSFGTLRAVADVSFSLNAGECLGLLGPNGAGKTTLLSMITGVIGADQGQILIEGHPLAGDCDPIKRRIGVVPQDLALYEELTPVGNLRFFGALYGLERSELEKAIRHSLELVGLADRAKERVRHFSGGMKRRLNIAAALLHDPQLLLLDEPTVGVDPQSRHAIFENIGALRAVGKTVLYTTHYMEEVERLCDRVVILDHGRVVADESLTGLKARMLKGCHLRIELARADSAAWLPELQQLGGIQTAELTARRLVVGMDDLTAGAPAVLALLSRHHEKIVHLESERPDLESIFLTLTGNQLRDL
jgi:ABC-2 type transport system ATP-binding protein